MTPIENLHYAIGLLAYSIAKADGEIQKEEKIKFANIVAAELRCKHMLFNISDIIFKVLNDEKIISPNEAYDWALKQIRLNSHYLSPQLKKTFIKVMEKIAKAYPPVTIGEFEILKKFKKDIKQIYGDATFYKNV